MTKALLNAWVHEQKLTYALRVVLHPAESRAAVTVGGALTRPARSGRAGPQMAEAVLDMPIMQQITVGAGSAI
jgi:hypothetical protein